MKYEVYKIQNKTTNKIYIGITTQGYERRFRKHLKEVEAGSNFILHNAIRSYGKDNFTITLLEEVNTIEDLKERERFWIKSLNTTNRDKGYNMTEGGDGTFGRLHSEETKNKIAIRAIGRAGRSRINVEILNLDTKDLTFYKSIGEACKALGKGSSYLSDYRRKYGKETLTVDKFQVTFSKEVFEKPKKKVRDITTQMKNLQQRSKEVRAANPEYYNAIAKKAQEGKRKAVLQIDSSGNIVNEYLSRAEAIELSGYSKTGIAHALKGRKSDYKGYIWKYKE